MSFFGPKKPGWLPSEVNLFVKSNSRPASTTGPKVSVFVNAVYYPNWHIYKQRPPSCLRLDVISHIFYAFAWVREDGTVYLSDDWADDKIDVDGTKGCLRACVALKSQHPHLKVILSIGGGGKGSENFAAVAADPTKRNTFAVTARQLCDTYQLNGIDIDWEHPSDPLQGQHYTFLLSSIRQYLPSPLFTLTSALPGSAWALRNILLSLAARHLDFINLMCYDYSGPWTRVSGHHAALFAPGDASAPSGHAAVTHCITQQVPAAKILLGVPCYGRAFPGATGPGQAFTPAASDDDGGTFEFRDLPPPAAAAFLDEKAVAAYCVGGAAGFVSYDLPSTVRMKARFAREARLAGLFYWTGTGDCVDGGEEESLVVAGYCELHR